MNDTEKDEFLNEVVSAHDRYHWAIQISDVEAANYWEGDLFALCIKGAGISDAEFSDFLKRHPLRKHEV